MSENRDRRPPMRRDVLAPEIDPPADMVKTGNAGAKVSVWCKLPHGLIMRLYAPVTRAEPVMGGGMREVTVWVPTGASVVVRGNKAPYGVAPTWPIICDFGVTHNVAKDFWDAWLEQNKTLAAVVEKLIFAFEDSDSGNAKAKEYAALKSGLEPLDPENLPRGLGARTAGGGIVHPISTDTGVKSL